MYCCLIVDTVKLPRILILIFLSMKIRFKPFATLADHVPESSPNNALELEAATGFAIDLVIEQFRLLGQLVQRAMLNELHINPQDSAKTALDEGDVFEI